MQAYEGYFENGQFVSLRPGRIPERKRVILTVLDEPVRTAEEINEHAQAWREFLDAIAEIHDEPIGELERVKFREIDI
jgi:hypothetical protein